MSGRKQKRKEHNQRRKVGWDTKWWHRPYRHHRTRSTRGGIRNLRQRVMKTQRKRQVMEDMIRVYGQILTTCENATLYHYKQTDNTLDLISKMSKEFSRV